MKNGKSRSATHLGPKPSTKKQTSGKGTATLSAGRKEDVQRLLHELRVQQVELEMQNDELRRTQAELEASHARYMVLYDMAPAGLITLNSGALIQEANLNAAPLIGIDRSALVMQPLTRFILKDDQDIFFF